MRITQPLAIEQESQEDNSAVTQPGFFMTSGPEEALNKSPMQVTSYSLPTVQPKEETPLLPPINTGKSI